MKTFSAHVYWHDAVNDGVTPKVIVNASVCSLVTFRRGFRPTRGEGGVLPTDDNYRTSFLLSNIVQFTGEFSLATMAPPFWKACLLKKSHFESATLMTM